MNLNKTKITLLNFITLYRVIKYSSLSAFQLVLNLRRKVLNVVLLFLLLIDYQWNVRIYESNESSYSNSLKLVN